MEFLDAEMLEERDLGVDEVEGGERGELGAPRFSRIGVEGGGAGAAVAAAEVIGADDAELVGVEGEAWADHGFPPAFVHFGLPEGFGAGDVGVPAFGVVGAREGVEEKDGVGAVGVESAPHFVGDAHFGEFFSRLKWKIGGIEEERFGRLRHGKSIVLGEGARRDSKSDFGLCGVGKIW